MNGLDDIEFACLSDVGMRRSHNQDSHATLPATDREQWQLRGHVFLVADGMGAHAVGELASKLAADSIPHIYSKHAHEGPSAALRRAFVEANLSIHNRGQANKEFEGMGTTGTALVVRPEGVWIGHVGDSRAYRVRGGLIEQLSFDHSLVWELARRQKKNPDEVENVPSNVIIRSLGPEPLVQVDVEGPHPVQPGDAFVLCSDGLSGPVTDRHIGAVVSSLPPGDASRLLVHLANLQGGPDNITAIVIRIAERRSHPRDDGGASGPGKRPWYQQLLPLSILALLLGILLAAAAIYLASERIGGQIPAFLLSAVFLVAGVLGLIMHSARENKRISTESEVRPLRIYRKHNCLIDHALVHEIRQSLTSLEGRLTENSWDLDWDGYRAHLERGQDLEARDQLAEAYTEYCKAMIMTLDVLGAHRARDEAFRPLWDKAPEKR